MRARIRMVDGNVVVIDDFGAQDARKVSDEMMGFVQAASLVLGKVDGGFFVGTEHSTGRLHIFICANVSTVTVVE